tara:strand:+ start:1007 stop:1174 length:168 start_codon:yes stop_codon:yes gene_type:complete
MLEIQVAKIRMVMGKPQSRKEIITQIAKLAIKQIYSPQLSSNGLSFKTQNNSRLA